jgi:hypothetical protein
VVVDDDVEKIHHLRQHHYVKLDHHIPKIRGKENSVQLSSSLFSGIIALN